MNALASSLAFLSYLSSSVHVFLGDKISDGTPLQLSGILIPKIECLVNSTFSSSPFNAALIIDLVYESLILLP